MLKPVGWDEKPGVDFISIKLSIKLSIELNIKINIKINSERRDAWDLENLKR